MHRQRSEPLAPGNAGGDAAAGLPALPGADLRSARAPPRHVPVLAGGLCDDRLVDRGRAERAEAWLEAERARVAGLEARLTTLETELAEARLPWAVRVVRAIHLERERLVADVLQ